MRTRRTVFRSGLCTAFVLVAACSSESRPTRDKPTTPVAKPVAVPTLSPALADANLQSYWKTSEAQKAARLFEREDYSGALEAFTALELADEDLAKRRDLMVAICQSKLRRHEVAAKGFVRALAAMPHLSDYLNYQAARSLFFAKQGKEALTHARAVRGESVHAADAELLVGDILRGQDDAQAIYDHYKAYLDTRPNGIRRPEARWYMASAAEKLGKKGEAKEQWHVIASAAPLSRWADKVEKHLSSSKELEPLKLTANEYITRGHVYYRKNRNEKSEADFAAALSAGPLDAEATCDASYHRANSVYKQRDRTRAAPLFLQALRDCDGVTSDLYVKAAYQAGRSFATLGESSKALKYYALIEERHPSHSYADDARLLQAETYERLGKHDKAKEFLASMATLYPKGDMGTEALWRLAWRSYKDQKFEEAASWLQKQIDATEDNVQFWAEGQALYWLGRTQAKRGKTEASLAAYRRVIREFPLSYYSLLALNRLREAHPAVFSEVVEELKSPPKTPGEFQFRERDVYASAGFARVVEFLRLGLGTPATSELHRLGFRSPPGRDPLTDPDEIDKAWAVSYLHHSLGNFGKALWSTRWHVLDYKRHWPVGGWRTRWEIAYPPGYEARIAKFSEEQGIPSELVTSFVREESGFDPIQESFANAIGLSQLIIPTAKRFAEGTGIEVSRETLRIPENNLRIGTNFMGFLMKKWDGQISLVAPSYNAGENAVARWMRERGSWDRDAFAEEIPYDETRRYAKRVIASYFTYRYLRHDEIPVFAN